MGVDSLDRRILAKRVVDGRKPASGHESKFRQGVASGHPQGRSAAKEPQSGLTRRNPLTFDLTCCGFSHSLFAIYARFYAAVNRRKLPSSTIWGDEGYYRIRTMLNCTNPGFPKTQLFESRGHGRVLHMPIVRRFGLGQRPAPARFSNYSVQPQAAGQVTCRPCAGKPSTETSNSTLDPPAARGMCPDADDPSVEAAEGAVSNMKAPELKPRRKQAHHGGILAPGGRSWEPERAAVPAEAR